jgi:hypothetical protein
LNTREFLAHVWPSTGPYCIARPFTEAEIANMPAEMRAKTHRPFRQWAVDNTDQAAELALHLDSEGHDVYFAVGALISKQVKNPKGRMVVSRKADNIRALRSYFLDLDVGTESGKYQSKKEAILALDKFCTDLNFPAPSIVDSGGGIHVYWTLQDEVPRDEWKHYAEQLKALTIANELKNDVAVVADVARVLRVVGTHNHKRAVARPVRALMEGQ